MKKILSLLLFVPFLVFGQYKLTSEGNYLNIEDQYTGVRYSHPSVDLYYQIFGGDIIPGSDIRMTAISSNTGTQVKATIGGYLAKIKN